MKHYPLREEMNEIQDPPRKTWFWELGEAVIDADRCVGCGTCVAVCPSNSIGVSADRGLPELVKMCTGCSLCWDFCPRAGLRYEATWLDDARDDPARAPDLATAWSITGEDPGEGIGQVLEAVAVRALHPAPGAQDGGAVTALLAALLEAGAIDGALVSKPSEVPDETWKGVATVATSVAELRAAAGSFYNQTMALAALDLSTVVLPADPRLAVVGTPCEVQGLRAMQLRPWPTGAHRVDAASLSIALFCTKSFDYEALVLDELERTRGIAIDQVARIDVTRGRFIVDDRSGQRVVDEPVRAFLGAALKGCNECADFAGRAADLSVGSVGSADGWTTVLVRTARGRAMLDVARAAFEVADLHDADALLRLDALNATIARRTLRRDLDPGGPLFIPYGEHPEPVQSTRTPVIVGR
jgi:coenzyme F420 hydrogenase subunit beta